MNLPTWTVRLLAWGLVFGAALPGAGCSRAKKERLKVVPVSGRVLVNGRPAAKAEVFFHPLDTSGARGSIHPFAHAEADGSFRVSTYESLDGAPVGEYYVTVVWPSVVKVDGEDSPGPDLLNGRYLRPEQSRLKVAVTEGGSQLPPLNLK